MPKRKGPPKEAIELGYTIWKVSKELLGPKIYKAPLLVDKNGEFFYVSPWTVANMVVKFCREADIPLDYFDVAAHLDYFSTREELYEVLREQFGLNGKRKYTEKDEEWLNFIAYLEYCMENGIDPENDPEFRKLLRKYGYSPKDFI